MLWSSKMLSVHAHASAWCSLTCPALPAAAAACSEVTEGLSPECPTIWDEALNATREEDECAQRHGVVKGSHCDPKNQVRAGGGREFTRKRRTSACVRAAAHTHPSRVPSPLAFLASRLPTPWPPPPPCAALVPPGRGVLPALRRPHHPAIHRRQRDEPLGTGVRCNDQRHQVSAAAACMLPQLWHVGACACPCRLACVAAPATAARRTSGRKRLPFQTTPPHPTPPHPTHTHPPPPPPTLHPHSQGPVSGGRPLLQGADRGQDQHPQLLPVCKHDRQCHGAHRVLVCCAAVRDSHVLMVAGS